MKIRQMHYVSGITLAIFIGLHLSNHLCSLGGIEFYNQVMNIFRLIYRNMVTESLLMLAIAVQVYSGIKLILQKRRTKAKLPFYSHLQIWTGLYLAIFLVIHTAAIMAGRYILKLDTNFYYGATVLNIYPYYLLFFTYYFLAIFSVFGHIAAVHRIKMQSAVLGLSPLQQANIILALSIPISFLIFYGMTAGFTWVEIPEAYKVVVK